MIHLIVGDNSYQRTQIAADIVAKHCGQFGQTEVERYEGAELSSSDLADVLRGANLFQPHRVVVINDLSASPVWGELPNYDSTNESTTVILHEPHPDKRTKAYKWLAAKAELHQTKLLADWEAARWLLTEAKQRKLSVSAQVADLLVARVGNDQWRLSHELDKLSQISGDLTEELIYRYVDAQPQANAFDVLEQAIRGTDALDESLRALEASEDPYRFFGLLGSQVYALAVASHAGSHSPDQAAKEAGIHPFVVKKSIAVARQIGNDRCDKIVHIAAETDKQLKLSSAQDAWTLIGHCLRRIRAAAN